MHQLTRPILSFPPGQARTVWVRFPEPSRKKILQPSAALSVAPSWRVPMVSQGPQAVPKQLQGTNHGGKLERTDNQLLIYGTSNHDPILQCNQPTTGTFRKCSNLDQALSWSTIREAVVEMGFVQRYHRWYLLWLILKVGIDFQSIDFKNPRLSCFGNQIMCIFLRTFFMSESPKLMTRVGMEKLAAYFVGTCHDCGQAQIRFRLRCCPS